MEKTESINSVKGIAWIENAFRPAYSVRHIRRGRQKGMFEVSYRRGSKIRKVKVDRLHKDFR